MCGLSTLNIILIFGTSMLVGLITGLVVSTFKLKLTIKDIFRR